MMIIEAAGCDGWKQMHGYNTNIGAQYVYRRLGLLKYRHAVTGNLCLSKIPKKEIYCGIFNGSRDPLRFRTRLPLADQNRVRSYTRSMARPSRICRCRNGYQRRPRHVSAAKRSPAIDAEHDVHRPGSGPWRQCEITSVNINAGVARPLARC